MTEREDERRIARYDALASVLGGMTDLQNAAGMLPEDVAAVAQECLETVNAIARQAIRKRQQWHAGLYVPCPN